MRKREKSHASPGAGKRRHDGLCMRCGKRQPYYIRYPVCKECWSCICEFRNSK